MTFVRTRWAILQVGWWVLLVTYLVASLAAVVMF